MKNIRIGLLIPHTDTTLEYDLQRELPSYYSIHTERMWLEDVTIESEKKMLEEELPRALHYLKGLELDLAIFGCTSAGSIYGLAGDLQIKEQIEQELHCPAISAYSAVYQRLLELNSRKIAVITPYIDNVTKSVVNGLVQNNFQVTFYTGMGKQYDTEIGKITPKEIIQFINRYRDDLQGIDTLFLSCTNLRALESKKKLESTFPVHVVTSNSAILRAIELIRSRII